MLTRSGSNYGQTLQSAIDTADGQRSDLRGSVRTETYKSLLSLAKCLGLDTVGNLQEWFASRNFKPAYDEFVSAWLLPHQEAAEAANTHRKKGPGLKAVVAMIRSVDSIGDTRYDTWCGIDKSEYEEIDHYALCLVRLRRLNKVDMHGIFTKKTCSDEEVDVRLWQAMLRGAYDFTNSRKKTMRQGAYDLSNPRKKTKRRSAFKFSNSYKKTKRLSAFDRQYPLNEGDVPGTSGSAADLPGDASTSHNVTN